MPLHTFTDYTKFSKVQVGKNSANEAVVQLIIDSLSGLPQLERHILALSDESSDEGTNSLMSDLITAQEKTIWMMQAWLN
jgi:starvation-inducible DNA-binding protein